MDPNSDMKSIEQSLTALTARVSGTASLDAHTRQALQKATQKLSLALETPGDTFQRIAFLVKILFSVTLLCSFPTYSPNLLARISLSKLLSFASPWTLACSKFWNRPGPTAGAYLSLGTTQVLIRRC